MLRVLCSVLAAACAAKTPGSYLHQPAFCIDRVRHCSGRTRGIDRSSGRQFQLPPTITIAGREAKTILIRSS